MKTKDNKTSQISQKELHDKFIKSQRRLEFEMKRDYNTFDKINKTKLKNFR